MHKNKVWIGTGVAVGATYMGLIAYLWRGQDGLLFPGRKSLAIPKPEVLHDRSAKLFSWTEAGDFEVHEMAASLSAGSAYALAHPHAGFMLGNPDASKTILALPGNQGDAFEYCTWVHDQVTQKCGKHLADSFRVISPYYRGYGGSKLAGNPSSRVIASDLLKLAEIVKPTSVFGRSLGGGLGAYVSAMRGVPAVLVSPWDSLVKVATSWTQGIVPLAIVKRIFNHGFEVLDHSILPDRVFPALEVIAFSKDRIIPLKRTEALLSRWTGPTSMQVVAGPHEMDISLTEKHVELLLVGGNG